MRAQKKRAQANEHESAKNRLLRIGAAHLALHAARRSMEHRPRKGDWRLRKVEYARVGGVRMGYRDFGRGEPLVLITGYCGTMDMWETGFVNELSKSNRIIMFDNRGMGFSTSSGKDFTIEVLAEDVLELLDALGISRANILGWSMGTYMAQEMALRHPERVGRLILYAADCGGWESLPDIRVMWELFEISDGPERHIETAMELLFPKKWLDAGRNPARHIPAAAGKPAAAPDTLRRQFKALMVWRGSRERIRAILQPTLLITGGSDIVTPPKNSRMMAGLIPHSELIVVDGAGHGLMYQYPVKFARAAGAFLRRANRTFYK